MPLSLSLLYIYINIYIYYGKNTLSSRIYILGTKIDLQWYNLTCLVTLVLSVFFLILNTKIGSPRWLKPAFVFLMFTHNRHLSVQRRNNVYVCQMLICQHLFKDALQ
jgi:hypothetical protein